jgi:MFS transporter, putative metabolite:H+ symporter
MDGAGTRSSVDDIVARLERLPTSWWQVKARIIVGVATFFDAFDALAIASVLPVIVPLWKLTPPQIGLMISASFLGQLLGALLFGWIAERYGRMTAMVWSIALFAVMSLACAFAWDYRSLLVLRTIQGIGLGGEVPVAAVFISELAKAQGRGRFVLLYELVFPIGLVAARLAGLWSCPISAGNTCSSSARCQHCLHSCCAAYCRNPRVGLRCTAATARPRRRCR